MKQLIFALFAFLLIAAGCSKEKSIEIKTDQSFAVRFVIDGVQKVYTENVLALRSEENGIQRVTVQGLADLSANPEGLVVVISQTSPIVAQTYPEVAGSDSPAILFRDPAGGDFTNLFLITPSGIEVTISEINATTIRGTFKGKVSDQTGNTRQISDGAFYAAFR